MLFRTVFFPSCIFAPANQTLLMKKIILTLTVFYISLAVTAQSNKSTGDTLSNAIQLDEVVISSGNFIEKKKNIAQSIDVITAKAIANSNTQNTGDLLMNTGKVFVQKSQQGGSSPVLRGFEASRVLLIVDGVRMNNAIYRSGHLQNSITADQNMLERAEILYGPSSTIYGSDALGGAIHLVTKSPLFSADKNLLVTGTSFARYGTVNNEKTFHAGINMGWKKIALLQMYSFSDFGDMKMGSHYPGRYPSFGKRDSFVVTGNGVDEIVANPDTRVQKFSGYRQWDITQKILFKQSENISHLLNVQFSNSTNVPRYDRLQDTRNGRLRYADWFYGPQKRFFAAYEFNGKNVAGFTETKLNVNYQAVEESRQIREFRRYDRFDSRVEKVKIFGVTTSARKKMNVDEIIVGADMQLNDVKSQASRTDLTNGAVSKLDSRYPNGKNRMNYFAVFAQHIHKFSNGKVVLNDGLRLQYVTLKSNVADNSFFKLPDTSVAQNNMAVTGNIGVVITASKNTIIKTSISSAFRVPNIDDLAKLFESSTAARQVVVPNSNIKPEYTYNFDVSLQQKIAGGLMVEVTGFYSLFKNAIVARPFTFDGQDSIVYNGVKSQVIASQNAGSANLYGFTVGITAALSKSLILSSVISYTHGRFKTDNSKSTPVYERQANGSYLLVNKNVSAVPLDHIPPVYGKTSFVYTGKKCSAELSVLYNSWKRLDQMSTSGEDNQQYATADGFPAWVIANWKGNYSVTKSLTIQAGVENIFDLNYRYFASGFSAGGRNIFIAARLSW